MNLKDDDLLPAPRVPSRKARRRDMAVRHRVLGGAAIGLMAVVVLVSVVVSSGGDDRRTRAERSDRRRAKGSATTLDRHSRTTSSTSGGLDATTSTPTGPSAADPDPATGTSPPTAVPGPAGPDPLDFVTVQETGGACRWDSVNEELADLGTLENSGSEDAVVEVDVVWSDASGELDSSSDLEVVPAGGSIEWSVSTSWSDPPQNLTCAIALI